MTLAQFALMPQALISVFSPTVDQLIDELVHLPAAAIDSALQHQGTFVLDPELDMSSPLGLQGFKTQSAQMNGLRKLIKVGSPAIPSLLAHLRDSRKTTFQLQGGDFSPLICVEYFDWGRLSGKRGYPVAADPNMVEPGKSLKAYNVTVGDLCYFALGQITNRCYLPIWSVGINYLATPTLYPRLATLAAKEWGGCTRNSLLLSLERDVLNPLTYERDAQAIRRLKIYFPDKVEGVVLQLLKEMKAIVRGKSPAPFREGVHPRYSIRVVASFSDIRSRDIDRHCRELLDLIRTGAKDGISRCDAFSIPLIQRLEHGTPDQRQACRAFCEARITARPSSAKPFYHLLRQLNRRSRAAGLTWLSPQFLSRFRSEDDVNRGAA